MNFEFDKIFGAELAAALTLGLFNFCRFLYPVLFLSYSFVSVRPRQFLQKERVLDSLTRRDYLNCLFQNIKFKKSKTKEPSKT